MICDSLKHSDLYSSVHPLLAQGLKWLAVTAIGDLPKGRHEIQGDALSAMVDEDSSRPFEQTRFEAHRIYGDIQLIISGSEAIDVCDIERLDLTEQYDAQRDVSFFSPRGDATRLVLTAGDFAVFFPNDGHRPQISTGNPQMVRKVVVKFRCAT